MENKKFYWAVFFALHPCTPLIHISWYKVDLGKKKFNERLSPSPRGYRNKLIFEVRGLLSQLFFWRATALIYTRFDTKNPVRQLTSFQNSWYNWSNKKRYHLAGRRTYTIIIHEVSLQFLIFYSKTGRDPFYGRRDLKNDYAIKNTHQSGT